MHSKDQVPTTPADGSTAGSSAVDEHASSEIGLTDLRGRHHRLSDFRGSPVVIVFHSPEWDPARSELVDSYNRIVSHVPHGGARLLSIAPDAPWHALEFAGEASVALPILVNDTDELRERLSVSDRSAVIVLDADGNVRWRQTATQTLPTPDTLARALGELLSERVSDAANGTRAATPAPWTRRQFVATVLAAGVALMLPPLSRPAEASTRQTADNPDTQMAVAITLEVNGRAVPLTIEPRVTLLDALREYAGLTGSKKGCDHGQCGACTVHIDGRRVLSCLTLAMMAQNRAITTIEGLAGGAETDTGKLHPMQQAFLAHDGFQCGYCTPGQIMSATAVLHEPWGAADSDVKEAMSGNICRCGAYPGIVAAVQEVRKQQGASRSNT